MYTVEWAGTATAALAELWLASESIERARINEAVLRMDALWEHRLKESRPDGRRILLSPRWE